MRRVRVAWLGVLAFALGCVTVPPASQPQYQLFEPVASADLWAPRINHWQAAQRYEAWTAAAAPAPQSPLAGAYAEFSKQLRRQLVEDTVDWVQAASGLYYHADAGSDAWPTLAAVKARGGDDCDGMELLTFDLLRRLGFGPGEIYRAILRDGEGYHHMVTLWFSDGARGDPYVLDPTGEVSHRVILLSAARGWTPVALFDETTQFRAVSLRSDRASAHTR